MRNLDGKAGRIRKQEAKKLARLNRRIARLSSELETLHYMQDRMERERETARKPVANLRK